MKKDRNLIKMVVQLYKLHGFKKKKKRLEKYYNKCHFTLKKALSVLVGMEGFQLMNYYKVQQGSLSEIEQ